MPYDKYEMEKNESGCHLETKPTNPRPLSTTFKLCRFLRAIPCIRQDKFYSEAGTMKNIWM